MKVILKSEVENLGRAGEIRQVARGFARNYLIPRGLAMEATPSAMAWFEKGKERREKAGAKALAEAKTTCQRLAAVALSFSRRVGENGKLFGSVGKSDVVKSLKASGYTIDKSAIRLENPIKDVGEHEVEVRLASDASAKIKVSVVPRG